jgi:hypothetical protein
MRIIVILKFLFAFVNCQYTLTQQSATLKAEQTLVTSLLNSYYSRDVRPSSQIDVSVNIQLKQIISLDEKNQILTISCYIEQFWYVIAIKSLKKKQLKFVFRNKE